MKHAKTNPAAGDGGVRQEICNSRKPANSEIAKNAQPRSWRDALPIHPAAELFPVMSPDDLRTLGEDIRKNGMMQPIVLWQPDLKTPPCLLDGRCRLTAVECVMGPVTFALPKVTTNHGGCVVAACDQVIILGPEIDPYTYVISANLTRRHLTAEQKRELIAKLIKAKPEQSNVQIAKQVKADDKTVAKVRREMERRSEIPNVSTRTDTRGRKQPANKATQPQKRGKPAGKLDAAGVVAHPYDERGLDLYETPPCAVRALLAAESFEGTIWEPACGPGSIVQVLRDAGHHVIATDLANYQCPDARGGVDFLRQTAPPQSARIILTNPPFMHADAFVRHALKLVPKVAMLLRLAFLESEGRSDILDGGQLARVHVFRNRLPMMHRAGWTGPQASSAIPFAWFVWDGDHQRPTELRRISWEVAASLAPDDGLGIPPFLRRAPQTTS